MLPRLSATLAQNFSGITGVEFRSVRFDSCNMFFQVIAARPLLWRLALVQTHWYDGDLEILDLPEQAFQMHALPTNLVDLVIDSLTSPDTGAPAGPAKLRQRSFGSPRTCTSAVLQSENWMRIWPTGLQRVDIFVSKFKTCAAEAVLERIPTPRTYMLRTGQMKCSYTLEMFGP
jgi:hypothetical protein